jgi:hypothetical protein
MKCQLCGERSQGRPLNRLSTVRGSGEVKRPKTLQAAGCMMMMMMMMVVVLVMGTVV